MVVNQSGFCVAGRGSCVVGRGCCVEGRGFCVEGRGCCVEGRGCWVEGRGWWVEMGQGGGLTAKGKSLVGMSYGGSLSLSVAGAAFSCSLTCRKVWQEINSIS